MDYFDNSILFYISFCTPKKNVCLFNELNAFCGWETSIERAQKICFPKNFENCFCRKIFLTLHYFFLQFPMTMAWRRCVNSETRFCQHLATLATFFKSFNNVRVYFEPTLAKIIAKF